jgi:hypothetical protein
VATTLENLLQTSKNARNTEPDRNPIESLDILRIAPFVQPRSTRQDFVWEREWRHRGDFKFKPSKLVAVLAPSQKHPELREKINALNPQWQARNVPILDPSWGTNQIVKTLSGVEDP